VLSSPKTFVSWISPLFLFLACGGEKCNLENKFNNTKWLDLTHTFTITSVILYPTGCVSNCQTFQNVFEGEREKVRKYYEYFRVYMSNWIFFRSKRTAIPLYTYALSMYSKEISISCQNPLVVYPKSLIVSDLVLRRLTKMLFVLSPGEHTI